jgi:cell filamentation protein
MTPTAKVSIRFYNDKEVRAIWDETNSKWWFSVLDIVGILQELDDYDKARNYRKYLKAKLKKEKNEVVSTTTQLKMLASDGKKHLTDTLDSDGIIQLAKQFPSNGGSMILLSSVAL